MAVRMLRCDSCGAFYKPNDMRKHYTLLFLFTAFLFVSCSKDFLKSYDKRVIGTWKIIDRDHYGFGGDDALPFKENDLFTFGQDGTLSVQRDTQTYKGSWDIQRVKNGDDDTKVLQLTAIDFTNQQVRSEMFNNMIFTNTNRFTAIINYNTRAYVYRFLRQ